MLSIVKARWTLIAELYRLTAVRAPSIRHGMSPSHPASINYQLLLSLRTKLDAGTTPLTLRSWNEHRFDQREEFATLYSENDAERFMSLDAFREEARQWLEANCPG